MNTKEMMTVLDTGIDVHRRRIYLHSDIDDTTMHGVVIALNMMEADDPERPITIYLCSDGGFITSGWAIVDAIQSCSCHIEIIGSGAIFSMATAILQAADNRVMMPHAVMFFHNAQHYMEGTQDASILKKLNAQSDRDEQVYAKFISDRSSIDVEEVKSMCETTTYLYADQALEMGLIDEIVDVSQKRTKDDENPISE